VSVCHVGGEPLYKKELHARQAEEEEEEEEEEEGEGDRWVLQPTSDWCCGDGGH